MYPKYLFPAITHIRRYAFPIFTINVSRVQHRLLFSFRDHGNHRFRFDAHVYQFIPFSNHLIKIFLQLDVFILYQTLSPTSWRLSRIKYQILPPSALSLLVVLRNSVVVHGSGILLLSSYRFIPSLGPLAPNSTPNIFSPAHRFNVCGLHSRHG